MKPIVILLTFASLLAAESGTASDRTRRWTGEIEGGAVFSGYNDVRIPNPAGTLFSLSRDLETPMRAYFRLRLTYATGRRHEISALYAPLTLKASGRSQSAILFQETLFPAGDLSGSYTFNSYRLTWRYRLVDRPRFKFWIGATAKIRDAEIALKSVDLSASKTDLGFVPLLHLRLSWDFHRRLGLLAEADALAGPQGRAEDLLVALVWKASHRLHLRVGYRFVEGGADVPAVYNFTFISYLSASLAFQF